MNHRKIVEEIIKSCYCAKKDLPDLIIHELRHMGIAGPDFKKCEDEIKKIIAEGSI